MRKFRVILPLVIVIVIFGALYVFLMKEKTDDDYELQLAPRSEFYNKKFGFKNAYLTKDISTSGELTNVRVNLIPGASEPFIVSGKDNSLFAFCNNYQTHGPATMFASEDAGMNWQEIDIPLSQKEKKVFYADPHAAVNDKGDLFYTAIETDNPSNFKVIYNKYDTQTKRWFDKAIVVDESNDSKFDKPKALYVNNNLYIVYTKKVSDGEVLCLARINNDGKIDKILVTDEETNSAALTADKEGNLYCVYLKEKEELLIKTSKDQGSTWSAGKLVARFERPGRNVNKQAVIKFGNNLGVRVNSDAQVAIYNNEIYVTYCAKGKNDNSDIYFTKADINNLNFSSPVTITNDNSNADQFLPALCIDETGKLYIIYQDSREDNLNVLINTYCSYSHNGGASFKDIKLSTQNFNPYDIVINGIYLGDYNSAVISGNELVSIWTDGRNKNFDIYASKIPLSALK